MEENGYRFTTFRPQDSTALAGFDFTRIGPAIARTALGLFRLNFDLFGWPSSLALALLALPAWRSRARLIWAMAGCYVLLHLFERDWGIDTFAPLHAFELALPLLFLTIVGAQNLEHRLRWAQTETEPRWRWQAFAPALLAALTLTAWIGFVPVRFAAVRQITSQLNQALRAPAAANLHQAVVFAPFPFAPPCGGTPNHFVFFRPANDPALANDVLWVNDLDVAQDRALLDTLQGRSGHRMRWTADCGVELLPLGELPSAAAAAPPS
jgi:hypothetical protein